MIESAASQDLPIFGQQGSFQDGIIDTFSFQVISQTFTVCDGYRLIGCIDRFSAPLVRG